MLWALGVLILVGYFAISPARQALESVAALKHHHGYVFSAISTATFGGLIPWVVARTTAARRASLRDLVFLTVFWALKGVEIDALYRLQASMFGDNRQPFTLTVKVLFDQFLYVPLWAIPSTVLAYQFRDDAFRLSRTRDRFAKGPKAWYLRDIVPVMISNWAVWIPAVLVIYTLPLALQLPIQNLVLCLWSLMLLVLVQQNKP